MIDAAVEFRRLMGKVVLFFTVLWFIAAVGLVLAAARGGHTPALNIALTFIPGLAFVPGAYFAVRLHLTSDRGQLDRIWPRALICGAAGILLTAVIIFAIDRWG